MRSHVRLIKAATAVALIASIASSATAMAGTRWTGADYCAVQNEKDDWALVGGASCNPTPSSNPNASWKQAIILDFDGLKTVNAATGATIETYGTLHAMLAELTENHASEGWMYVANKNPNQKDIIYLMVKISACAGNSDWYEAPACE